MLEVLAYVPAPHQDILPKEPSLAFPAQSRQVDPGWGWGEVDQSWAGEKQLHSCRIAESFHLPRSQNGTSAQDPPAPQRTSWAPLQGMLSVENSKVVQVQASPSLLPLESQIITIGQEPKVAEMQQSGWLVSRPRFTDRDTEIMWGFRAASSGLRSLTSCAALEDIPTLPPPGPRLPPPATRIH